MTSATFDPRGFDAETEFLEPERVSILAILGLVFGLLCFLPFFGLLGVIFAIAGLIAINRSRGRLAGTGMAIAGLILGLLFTAIWGAITLGMIGFINMVDKSLVGPANQAIAAIDNQDFATARTQLVPPSQPMATDEAFKALREAYRDELGAFKNIPSGIELAQSYAGLSKQFQGLKNMNGVAGRQDMIPIPANFEKGSALLLLSIEPPNAAKPPPPGQEFVFKFRNFTLILPSQKVINLIDPATFPPPAVHANPGLPQPPSEAPAPGEENPTKEPPQPPQTPEKDGKETGGG